MQRAACLATVVLAVIMVLEHDHHAVQPCGVEGGCGGVGPGAPPHLSCGVRWNLFFFGPKRTTACALL